MRFENPWLLLLLLPIAGPAWVAIELGLRRGTRGDNRFGPNLIASATVQEAAA